MAATESGWLPLNNGAFLLSPDGRTEVAHFTVDNSPLLSNEVYDIAIDQESGLVYFATPQGPDLLPRGGHQLYRGAQWRWLAHFPPIHGGLNLSLWSPLTAWHLDRRCTL